MIPGSSGKKARLVKTVPDLAGVVRVAVPGDVEVPGGVPAAQDRQRVGHRGVDAPGREPQRRLATAAVPITRARERPHATSGVRRPETLNGASPTRAVTAPMPTTTPASTAATVAAGSTVTGTATRATEPSRVTTRLETRVERGPQHEAQGQRARRRGDQAGAADRDPLVGPGRPAMSSTPHSTITSAGTGSSHSWPAAGEAARVRVGAAGPGAGEPGEGRQHRQRRPEHHQRPAGGPRDHVAPGRMRRNTMTPSSRNTSRQSGFAEQQAHAGAVDPRREAVGDVGPALVDDHPARRPGSPGRCRCARARTGGRRRGCPPTPARRRG